MLPRSYNQQYDFRHLFYIKSWEHWPSWEKPFPDECWLQPNTGNLILNKSVISISNATEYNSAIIFWLKSNNSVQIWIKTFIIELRSRSMFTITSFIITWIGMQTITFESIKGHHSLFEVENSISNTCN